MKLRKTLQLAHQILEDNQIEHALIGGFALALYGSHRATYDIDLLVDGDKKAVVKVVFANAGFELRNETEEVLQYKGSGFVDLLLANRPLSKAMLHELLNNTPVDLHKVEKYANLFDEWENLKKLIKIK